MEGILKAAPPPGGVKVEPANQRTEGISRVDNIDQEYFDYFNVKHSDKDNEQFKTVVNWAKKGKSLGDALLTLSRLETRLGVPSGGESRLNKIYNYVRTTSNLENRKLAMKETIDTIRNKHKAFISQLEKEYGNKVEKLKSEFERVTNEYNRARNEHESTASDKSGQMRKEYAAQLAELKKMRAAYKGGK